MSTFINEIQPSTMMKQTDNNKTVSPGDGQGQFANTLKAVIEEVNDTQNVSDKQTKNLASGNVDDLHSVMTAAQKASITLETSVQVQRKVIDAYNEIMRMQV